MSLVSTATATVNLSWVKRSSVALRCYISLQYKQVLVTNRNWCNNRELFCQKATEVSSTTTPRHFSTALDTLPPLLRIAGESSVFGTLERVFPYGC